MNHTHPTPAAAETPAAANPNGQPTLSDRVRALRLKGSGAAAPRSAFLPWGLTVIALAMTGVFAWRAYRISPADVAASGDAAGGKSSPSGGPGQPAMSTGEVALDNKGTVVAPHTIQISPQVGGEIVWL